MERISSQYREGVGGVENLPLENVAMYEISGQHAITTRSVERYRADHVQNQEIEELAPHSPQVLVKKILNEKNSENCVDTAVEYFNRQDEKWRQDDILKHIENQWPEKYRISFITKSLAAQEIAPQLVAAELILFVDSKSERARLLEVCFSSPYHEVLVRSAKVLNTSMVHDADFDRLQNILYEKIVIEFKKPHVSDVKNIAGAVRYLEKKYYSELVGQLDKKIRQGLVSSIPSERLSAAETIPSFSLEKQAEYILLCLQNQDKEVQRTSVSFVEGLLESDRGYVLVSALDSAYPDIRLLAVRTCHDLVKKFSITESDLIRFVDALLKHSDQNCAREFFLGNDLVPAPVLSKCVPELIESHDVSLQQYGARYLDVVPYINDRLELFEHLLNSDNVVAKMEAIFLLRGKWSQPKYDRLYSRVVGVVTDCLHSPDETVQDLAIQAIQYSLIDGRERDVLRQEVDRSVEQMLMSSDPKKFTTAVRRAFLIKLHPDIDLITMCLSSQHREAQLLGCEEAHEKNIVTASLVEYGLSSVYPEVQVWAFKNIHRIMRAAERAKYLRLAARMSQHALREIIEPPLYAPEKIATLHQDANPRLHTLSKFKKTGSETTVIEGPLRNRSIIRHIEPEAFLMWQKAYENVAAWKTMGYEHVPIEPIIHYTLDTEKKLVDVHSGVLDISLGTWLSMVGSPIDQTATEHDIQTFEQRSFYDELCDDRTKLIACVRKLGIMHGHDDHYNNFCLRFYRDEKGNVDITKKPRVYMIDFDRAAPIK